MPPQLTIRPGHPLFLDLPWDRPIATWTVEGLLDLPKGISRHEVRFLSLGNAIYVIKELATAAAHNDYTVLRALETEGAPAAAAVGVVENRVADRTAETSAALDHCSMSPFPSRTGRCWPDLASGPADPSYWTPLPVYWSSSTWPGVFGATAASPTCSTDSTPKRSKRSWSTPKPPRCTSMGSLTESETRIWS